MHKKLKKILSLMLVLTTLCSLCILSNAVHAETLIDMYTEEGIINPDNIQRDNTGNIIPGFYASNGNEVYEWDRLLSRDFGWYVNVETINGVNTLTEASLPLGVLVVSDTINAIGSGLPIDINKNIVELIIPASVNEIDENALSNCNQMKLLYINSNRYGVEFNVPDNAFSGCENLSILLIDGRVPVFGESLRNKQNIKVVRISGGATIPNNCFANYNNITSVIIGGDTLIGERAFFNCKNLKTIAFDESVSQNAQVFIQKSAFEGCSSVEDLNLPNGIAEIGDAAFASCKTITSIMIPESVGLIGEAAFDGCISLISIQVDENNPIYDSRDGCNAIVKTNTNTIVQGCKKTAIVESIEIIGNSSFKNQTGITSVTIPVNITSIQNSAFIGCISLRKITFKHAPNNALIIDDNAFKVNDMMQTDVYINDEANLHSSISNYMWINDKRGVSYHIDPTTMQVAIRKNKLKEKIANEENVVWSNNSYVFDSYMICING